MVRGPSLDACGDFLGMMRKPVRGPPSSRALDDDTLWICLPSLAAMPALDITHRLDLWISDIFDASHKLVALWLQG